LFSSEENPVIVALRFLEPADQQDIALQPGVEARTLSCEPYGCSAYVSDEGEASARASYGPNFDRLVALKNKYDQTNFFRMNHNIRPSQAASEQARA
jgi:hypothetical protein